MKKSDRKFKQHYVLFEGEAAGAGAPKAGKRSDVEGEAAGAGAPKAGKRSDGLLECRLMKTREEKGEFTRRLPNWRQGSRTPKLLHSLHRLRR